MLWNNCFVTNVLNKEEPPMTKIDSMSLLLLHNRTAFCIDVKKCTSLPLIFLKGFEFKDLDKTILILFFRGRLSFGSDFHVFLPIKTTFFLLISLTWHVVCLNILRSLGIFQGIFPFIAIPILSTLISKQTASIPKH